MKSDELAKCSEVIMIGPVQLVGVTPIDPSPTPSRAQGVAISLHELKSENQLFLTTREDHLQKSMSREGNCSVQVHHFVQRRIVNLAERLVEFVVDVHAILVVAGRVIVDGVGIDTALLHLDLKEADGSARRSVRWTAIGTHLLHAPSRLGRLDERLRHRAEELLRVSDRHV